MNNKDKTPKQKIRSGKWKIVLENEECKEMVYILEMNTYQPLPLPLKNKSQYIQNFITCLIYLFNS